MSCFSLSKEDNLRFSCKFTPGILFFYYSFQENSQVQEQPPKPPRLPLKEVNSSVNMTKKKNLSNLLSRKFVYIVDIEPIVFTAINNNTIWFSVDFSHFDIDFFGH